MTVGFVERWEQVVHDRDAAAMADLLAEDVVFRSPAVFRPTEGREAVSRLLGHVMEVFGTFRYTQRFSSGDGVVLRFATEVQGPDRVLDVDGVDIFELDDDGRVASLTVMLRPLSVLAEVAAQMAARLAGHGM